MVAKKGNRRSTLKKEITLDSKKKLKNNEPVKSYKELIVEALISFNDRRGSSRAAIKKYIREKYPSVGNTGSFDSYINNAIKKGVESKEFELPRGATGGIKLYKGTRSTDTNKKVDGRGRPRKEENKVDVKKPEKGQLLKSKTKGASKESSKEVSRGVSKGTAKGVKAALSPTYKEMIIAGILQLNNGKGSSRSALKKFVKDQYKNDIKASSNFDYLFNNALRKGIESGDLHQPKGPSGVIKVLKKKKPSDTLIKTA